MERGQQGLCRVWLYQRICDAHLGQFLRIPIHREAAGSYNFHHGVHSQKGPNGGHAIHNGHVHIGYDYGDFIYILSVHRHALRSVYSRQTFVAKSPQGLARNRENGGFVVDYQNSLAVCRNCWKRWSMAPPFRQRRKGQRDECPDC